MLWDKRTITAILLFSLLRLIIASIVELGNDESYYWLYSQKIQWNYFDHPPLVALGVRIFTLNLTLQEYELFVRLGSIVSCAFSSWFMYRAVTIIANKKAGWYSVILFNVSFYAGIVAGILVMPDSPQLLCWTFCLWMIARLIQNENDWKSWIGFGIGAGLCIMSKVHGVFLWLGMGLFILFHNREWLKKKQTYVSLFISMIIASPLLLWNMKYDFITWRFHSERVDISEALQDKDSFLTELLGQVLVNNPVNFLLIGIALVAAYRSRRKNPPTLTAYNYVALPMAGLFIFISIFRDIWPHWSGPAYTSLIPAAAVWLERRKFKRIFPSWLRVGIATFLFFIVAWLVTVSFYPGTYGSKSSQKLGKGDVTLDKFGWEEAGEEFVAFYYSEQESGRMPPNAPLVCAKWWGAHLEYYFSDFGSIPVIGLGEINELHQYAWLNEERVDEANMSAAYCIISSIETDEVSFPYYDYYEKLELVKTLLVKRSGKPAKKFFVYRLSGWKGVRVPEL